ncbi:MAG: hypothetical protein PHU03_05735, partial [Syntrophales bacterium]|nr:hypothetical protein [Syntrophales bacterium]
MKTKCCIITIIIVIGVVMLQATSSLGQQHRSGEMAMAGRHHQASGTNFISKAVPEEPAMDRIDGIWNTVGGISVQLMPMGAHGLMGTHRNVELRSVHTNTNIYLYASWPDPTESV